VKGDHSSAVLCVGLGGTKIEIGLLTDDNRFFSSGEILWRSRPEFARHLDATNVAGFCSELVSLADSLLRKNSFAWSDIGVIGVPFPGPQSDKLWYSNNLTRAFLDGVALEEALITAVARLTPGSAVPDVRVLLDAACDAGGELYHPEGRLYRQTTDRRASVINIATGIAAGYTVGGRILLADDEVRALICADYDSGVGQLGRHLWYDPIKGGWSYHYRSEGLTPQVPPPAIRMTDYLSGPAVAVRLLHHLGDAGLLASVSGDEDTLAPLLHIYHEGLHGSLAKWLVPAAQMLRTARAPLAGSLLSWLDAAYEGAFGEHALAVADALVAEVVADFAGVVRAWIAAPGWRDWAGFIVLTGGFGLRFLARSDAQPERSFCHRLEALMMPATKICRSRMHHATLREAYIFLRQ